MAYGKILVAVDNSEHALNAAKKAFELADQLHGNLIIVSVADPSREVIPELALPTESHHEKVMKEANIRLDSFAKQYANVKAIQRLDPIGTPKEEIIKTAETLGADIIVMGTHGRTGLISLLMGSVAEYIIKHSKIPVMVVSLNVNK